MLGQNHVNCCGTHGFVRLFSSPNYNFPSTRKVVVVIKAIRGDSANSTVKKALLTAKKKERIKLPTYENASENRRWHISEFLNHPIGIEAMLNVNALEYYVPLDANMYRLNIIRKRWAQKSFCQVIRAKSDAACDLRAVLIPLSTELGTLGSALTLLGELVVVGSNAKFEGSDIVESQNKHFAASMKNFIRWDDIGSESFLDVDVKLGISLEIYNKPFSLMPVSAAIEGPGNLVAQALLDRFVPLLS